jgi:hypothetical protein
MRFRKLRIAWSVGWGAVAFLLVAYWLRSYWYSDTVIWFNPSSYDCRLTAFSGYVEFQDHLEYGSRTGSKHLMWRLAERPNQAPATLALFTTKVGFVPGGHGFVFPLWILLTLPAAVVAVAWAPWSGRFSLRTLLIATTLVAVVLGLAVYAASK